MFIYWAADNFVDGPNKTANVIKIDKLLLSKRFCTTCLCPKACQRFERVCV